MLSDMFQQLAWVTLTCCLNIIPVVDWGKPFLAVNNEARSFILYFISRKRSSVEMEVRNESTEAPNIAWRQPFGYKAQL